MKYETNYQESAELASAMRPILIRAARSTQGGETPVLVRIPVTVPYKKGLLVESAKARAAVVVLTTALVVSGIVLLQQKFLLIPASGRPAPVQPLSTAVQKAEHRTTASSSMPVPPLTRSQNRNAAQIGKAIQPARREPVFNPPPILSKGAATTPFVKATLPEPPEVGTLLQQSQNIAALIDLQERELALNFANKERARRIKNAGDSSWLPLPQAGSPDADAVLVTLRRYSEAWSAKDVSKITALRPGLSERQVKKELSSVRSIAMRIRPLSSPKIEGDHAAVECIHEVNEVFSGGVTQLQPGMRMNYALVRRGRAWLIENSTVQTQR